MKILVTGADGFIGSHLVEELLWSVNSILGKPDCRVHVVDDLSTSPIDVNAYLSQLRGRDRLSYHIGSVINYFK